MDLLLKKMPSAEECARRERPWIVRNKLVGLLELADHKKYACVSLFETSMEAVPRACWKLLKVKGLKDILVCSKTLTFVSSAKAEFVFDNSNTVVTHAFIDCIRDDFSANDKQVFWKHQMELYFQLINSLYENVQELDETIVEEISKGLQETSIVDENPELTEQAKEEPAKQEPELTKQEAEAESEEDWDEMPELELVPPALEE
jgi:hypothetical protein